MAGMSALVLRVVFSCSFPFFPSFLLFCICLPLSRFFHSRYFCSKQRTQSCSHSLMGSVYTWGQAKPYWSQTLHPSLALFIPSALSQLSVPQVFPVLPRAAGTPGWGLPGYWNTWMGFAWLWHTWMGFAWLWNTWKGFAWLWHTWLGFPWLLSVPPVQSFSWTLGQALITPLTYFICFKHMVFRERDSLLLFVITHCSTTQLPWGSRHHMLL